MTRPCARQLKKQPSTPGISPEEKSLETKNIPGAPEAIGPYCHAMIVGNLVFCSGQTPLDPESMVLIG